MENLVFQLHSLKAPNEFMKHLEKSSRRGGGCHYKERMRRCEDERIISRSRDIVSRWK